MMHLLKEFVLGSLIASAFPFLLIGSGKYPTIFYGVGWLSFDLFLIYWTCSRSMHYIRAHTQWPEMWHGLPIAVLTPVIFVGTNDFIVLAFMYGIDWHWL